MELIFEDEFMDVQSTIISLCLELVAGNADKVFAYGSLEEKSTSFNAFYVIGGKVTTINKLNISMDTLWSFLHSAHLIYRKSKTYAKSIICLYLGNLR